MWNAHFDERQNKEIAFSRFYAEDFNHGTDGHNAKIIIAKMARLLDQYELLVVGLGGDLILPESKA